MSFFYDLNKKLDSIRATPEVTHKQLNERDEGKPGKNFAKIAKDAGERYGSKAAGERVAGAVRNKLKAQGKLEEEGMSRAAKGYEKYGKQGMEALAKAGREGKDLDKIRDKYNKYDDKSVDEDRVGPTDAGPMLSSPDSANYKTPNLDKRRERTNPIDKAMDDPFYSFKKYPGDLTAALDKDAQGQIKYVNRTAPGIVNKIKDKLGYDMPDSAYGPRPDETQRLLKRYPAPTKESAGPAAAKPAKPAPAKPSKPAPKGDYMGTIKGGVWTADPPKSGERGVPAPSGDPEGVKEAGNAGPLDFDKVLDAIAALYGDDIWDNDAMQDLAHDLEQAGPTDRELDFIIAKGRLPKRLAGTQFSAGDSVQFGESGSPMTSKQKSFAKLAPPANKITFADKIAGAKKEVDEMLGDVAAEAMRSALGGGRGRNAEMDEDNAFDYKSPRKDAPRVGSIERGHKHDIKHTATGRMVTRRTDDQGNSVGADDDSDTQAGPRGRGRPKGTKGAIGAKGPSGKSKLMTKEGEVDIRDQGEYDQEGDMAKNDIKTIVRHAQALSKVLGDNDNLPEWVQSKLAKIEGMMISVDEYMQNQASDEGDEEPIAEKAVSKQQQKFMGMAHAMQKGEKIKGASKELKKVAKTMKPKDVEDFAKTKHKGLPDKVKKKEVDENSDDGRLVTKQTAPGKTSTSSTTGRISATVDKGKVEVKPAKSSSGMSFGKGIYDSMNRELELMIAESMSINMSDSTEGNKSLTVTATDEDAMKLAMMLKSAGLGGQGRELQSDESCSTCGMPDCGCGDVQEAVDENAPDWPTNTETSDDALQYAGGLNKPKTDVAGDGQTTIPNTAVHTQDEDALRRMMEMAGLAEGNMPMVKKDGKMVPAFAADGKGKNDLESKDKEDDTVDESIRRMMEIAGVKKKPVDEEKTEEGNLFTKGLEDDDVKIGDKIPGTNAIKKKDIDESIFALTNQWKTYKG